MRPIRAVLASLVAVALAAATISSALAQRAFGSGDFAAALRLNPLLADAATAQAAAELGDGRQAEAKRLAHEAIDRSPVSADAAAILGFIRDGEAGPLQAGPFMETAASMSWASETAQLWMLGRAAAARDYDQAVLRADALIRQRLLREELLIFVRGLTAEPGSLRPLARRLAAKPRWRNDYMRRLERVDPRYFAAHEALLGELARTSAPPLRDEVRAYAARLVHAGQYTRARAAWGRFEDRVAGGESVDDGSFQRLVKDGAGSPFEWTYRSEPGVFLGLERPPGAGNTLALHITSDGRPAYRALEQLIVLEPGSYMLVSDMREGEPGSLDSLHWEVVCLEKGVTAEIGAARRTPPREGWQRLERHVSIPVGCAGQRLELRVDHDEARDLDAWIRMVRVSRLARSASTQGLVATRDR